MENILFFLDSNDIFYPNMLYELRKRERETDADVVVCRYKQFFGENQSNIQLVSGSIQKEYLTKKDVFNIEDFKKYAFQLFSGMTWNKMFRTEFINNTKFKFLNLKNSNDTFFVFMNIFNANKIACVEEALLKYRILNESISHAKDKFPLCFLEALENIYHELEKNKIPMELRTSFVNRVASNTRWNFSLMSDSVIETIIKDVGKFYNKIGMFNENIDSFYDKSLFSFVDKIKEQYKTNTKLK